MAGASSDKQSPIQVVLNELDEFALQWDEQLRGDCGWECQRTNHRRKLRTQCDIWFYEDGGKNVRQQTAQTRNLSEKGLGLVTKCVILQGTPIEVRIQVPNRPPTHLAGVVAFCRYTQQGFHEVGIELLARISHGADRQGPPSVRQNLL